MSQQPPELPLGYATPAPHVFQRERRPPGVTAIAVLGIVFGGLGSLIAVSLLLQILRLAHATAPTLVSQAYEQNGVMLAWSLFGKTSGVAMSLIGLFGGITSLSLKPIGRKLLLLYAWYGLILALPTFLINTCYIQPKAEQWRSVHQAKLPIGASAMQITMVIELAISIGIDLCILYAMTRPAVKEGFLSKRDGP